MDDRTTGQPTGSDVSNGGSGAGVRSVSGDTGKPARTHKLRASFWGNSKPFAAHGPDPGAAGAVVQPAAAGDDGAPEAIEGADESQGRGAAIQQAGRRSAANRPAKSKDEGASGGRVRGRRAYKKKDTDEAKLPAAILKLVPKKEEHSSPKVTPTESERADARRLFREIGQKFNENRKKSKTAAYAGFRHDLMDNLDTLVMGGAIDLKEATTIITNLEQYTKETEAESTETPATILGRWLRMSPSEMEQLQAPPEEEPEEELEEPPDEEIEDE